MAQVVVVLDYVFGLPVSLGAVDFLEGKEVLGLTFGFQQDNDPTHLTGCVRDFTKKESDGVLHQMTWPPQSQLRWFGMS